MLHLFSLVFHFSPAFSNFLSLFDSLFTDFPTLFYSLFKNKYILEKQNPNSTKFIYTHKKDIIQFQCHLSLLLFPAMSRDLVLGVIH